MKSKLGENFRSLEKKTAENIPTFSTASILDLGETEGCQENKDLGKQTLQDFRTLSRIHIDISYSLYNALESKCLKHAFLFKNSLSFIFFICSLGKKTES